MDEGGSVKINVDGLSLSERAAHKNWKVRLEAYEALENLFKQAEENDKCFVEYASIWKGVISDNNAAAQEKGLDALNVFLDRATKEGPKLAPLAAPLLIDKCLGGRDKTKQKATSALLLFIEIEAIEPVISALVKGAGHKVPKVAAASISVIRDAIKSFGTKPLPIKPVFAALVGFFDHADKNVRSEASALVVEMYRWLGAVIEAQIQSLRQAQVTDLKAAFQEVQLGKAVPERFLRSQQNQPIPVAAEPVEEKEVDMYDMSDAVDILPKLKSEFWEGLTNAKWSIRKDQLEAFIALASVPKIANGDYFELVKALKKLVGDANVVVVSKAVKCISLLAAGLRKDFAAHAKTLLPVLFDKFKEKKATVVDAIHEALDNMYGNCFLLPEVVEDIVATGENKVPKVRQDTLDWITRCLVKSTNAAKRASVVKVVKPLANFLLTNLDDSSPDVRESAAKTFGNLVGIVGERTMTPYLSKLDKVRTAKVKEFIPEGAAAPPPAAVQAASVEDNMPSGLVLKPSKKEEEDVEEEKPKKPVATKAPAKRVAAAPEKKAAPAKVAAPAKKATAAAPAKAADKKKKAEDFGPGMTTEEGVAKAKEVLPESIVTGLSSANWKERLAATEELSSFVEKLPETPDFNVDAICHLLQSSTKAWKESNFQVLSACILIVGNLARSKGMSKSACVMIIPGIIEKIADLKVKAAVSDCLTGIVEGNNVQFGFQQLYSLTSKHKNPKVTLETLTWMASTLDDFGISGLQLKPYIDFSKECFESSNAAVRSQAIKTLGVLKKFVGASLLDYFNDVKPALLKTIEEEFSKVVDAPNAPTKACKEAPSDASGGGSDALPREDISGQISAALLKQLGDANWKVRKEGLEAVTGIVLSANKRIGPNLGGLPAALKARVADSNKNLACQAMELIGLLASAAGPQIEKSVKPFLPAVLANFADNKKNVRDSVCDCLTALVQEMTMEPLVPLLAEPIVTYVIGRKDLLSWISKHLSATLSKKKIDLTPLVKPLIACLEDKSAEVRHAAEAVLKEVAPVVGVEAIKKQCSDLKPASKMAIAPILESLRTAVAEAKAAPAPVAAEEQPKTKAAAPAPAKTTSEKPTKSAIAAPTKSSGIPAPKTTAANAKPAPKVDTSAPLVRNDQKEQRNKKSKVKWTFDEPRQDMIDSLSEQMQPFFGDSLFSKFFSPDFKKYIEALTEMTGYLDTFKQEFIDSLDLILKWITLRFFDSNMAVLKKTTEFVQALFTSLESQDYHLSDYEASIFIPFLVEKVGNNNDTIRSTMKSTFKLLSKLYPASKLAKFLLEGLKSKNARTRSDSLDELAYLIERQGITVIGLKAIPVIAELATERESTVRNAALNCLVKCHLHIGNELFKNLPNLPDAAKEALQEKLKYAPTVAAPPVGVTGIPKKKPVEPIKTERYEEESAPQTSSITPTSKFSDEISVELEDTSLDVSVPVPHIIDRPVHVPLPVTNNYISSDLSSTSPALLVLDSLLGDDENKTIENLKTLCLSEDETLFLLYSDKLVEAITNRLHTSLSSSESLSLRLLKYLLNGLHVIFTKTSVAKSIGNATLSHLITQILYAMVDSNLAKVDEEQHILRALNLLLIKILETSPKSNSWSIMFELLNSKETNAKLKDVTSKCVLKLTKTLSSGIEDINLNYLLRDIHLFLESQRGSTTDSFPLKTIKTVLNELVTIKGQDIKKYLSLVPTDNGTPIIVHYLNKMLETVKRAPTTTNTEEEGKTSLTDIFKKIANKDTLQQGIADLYQYRENHPNIDLDAHLQKTSPQFQAYIKNGLEAIARKQTKTQTENRNPNTLSSASSSDSFALNYMDKIRKLQQQLGVKKEETVTAAAPVDSLQELRDRIRSVRGTSESATTTSVGTATNKELDLLSSASTDSSVSSDTTVADLRSRLARIKSSFATNNV